MPVFRKNNKFTNIPLNSTYTCVASRASVEWHIIEGLDLGKTYRIMCDAEGKLNATKIK
jgi:hypothetical protein